MGCWGGQSSKARNGCYGCNGRKKACRPGKNGLAYPKASIVLAGAP